MIVNVGFDGEEAVVSSSCLPPGGLQETDSGCAEPSRAADKLTPVRCCDESGDKDAGPRREKLFDSGFRETDSDWTISCEGRIRGEGHRV